MELKSTIEDVNSVTKVVKVTIPAETVTEKLEKYVTNVMRTARIDGFRPGKAPRNIIERRHGSAIREDVRNELIKTTFTDIVRENELRVVGVPEIEPGPIEPGKELEYSANVSIYPQPEVSNYDSFEVSAPKKEVKEENIDSVIENMRGRKAKVSEIEDRKTAEMGDVVDVTILMTVDGKDADRSEPAVVGLGEGKLPKEVEEALVGAEVGSTIETTVAHGDDHPTQSLRGKSVTYRVELKGLKRKELPEVTDEFAKELDPSVESVAALREKIRKDLEAHLESEAKTAAQAKILDQLLQRNDFEVPQILVDDEIRNMLARSGLMQNSNVNLQDLDVAMFRDGFGPICEKRVKSAILVDRIAEKEEIKASHEEIEKAMQEIAQENYISVDDVRRYVQSDPSRGMGLALEIERDKVLELLTSRAVITYTALEAEAAEGEEGEQVVE